MAIEVSRKSNGQFEPGMMTPELRDQITKGRRDQIQRYEEMLPRPTSGEKRCTVCKQIKHWNTNAPRLSEFVIRKNKLKSTGEVRRYPAPECRVCTNNRTRAHKEKLRAEGKLKETDRQYYLNRRKKLKAKKNAPKPTVPAGPFRDWLKVFLGRGNAGRGLAYERQLMLADKTGIPVDTINTIAYRQAKKNVTVELVDMVLTAADDGTTLRDLYPDQ